jgi:hypothetical protein
VIPAYDAEKTLRQTFDEIPQYHVRGQERAMPCNRRLAWKAQRGWRRGRPRNHEEQWSITSHSSPRMYSDPGRCYVQPAHSYAGY